MYVNFVVSDSDIDGVDITSSFDAFILGFFVFIICVGFISNVLLSSFVSTVIL